MQSLLYRLIAAVLVIAFLMGLALYIKSAGVRTPMIDKLRAAGAGHPGPDPPTLMQLRDAARKKP